jgi:two-component system, NarL family, response regulator LiaR
LAAGNHPIGCFQVPRWETISLVSETIRVALVNDYEIVLEGLRGLLRPYDPQMRVVELDVEGGPQTAVDVTLFDTYGEVQELSHRVRDLAADATNGAILVFSFSDDAALAGTFLRAGAQGFISKALPAEQIVNGIRAAARGERVMLLQTSPHAAMTAELQWPGRDARLTERESELLALLPTGMTNRNSVSTFTSAKTRSSPICAASSPSWTSATVPRPLLWRAPASSVNPAREGRLRTWRSTRRFGPTTARGGCSEAKWRCHHRDGSGERRALVIAKPRASVPG